jgi:hypothetical protein
MAELTINVTFKVSDEAYEAFENCDYQGFLEHEIADIMFTLFRNECYKKDVSAWIISMAKSFNEQAAKEGMV